MAKGGRDLVLSEGAGEIECGVADRAEHVGAVAFADTALVLAPHYVAWPMARFSMPQWPRHQASNRVALAWPRGTLVMAETTSTDGEPRAV